MREVVPKGHKNVIKLNFRRLCGNSVLLRLSIGKNWQRWTGGKRILGKKFRENNTMMKSRHFPLPTYSHSLSIDKKIKKQKTKNGG